MSFLKEYLEFLKSNKKIWMLPIILIILCFGIFVYLVESSYVAPFVYTLF